MNEFFPKLAVLGIDAVPRSLEVNANENKIEFRIESLINGFSEEDYKSAFFLLMDKVGTKNFISLTNQDVRHMKTEFIKICRSFTENFWIELFGTLKMYKRLKEFETCFHIYENKMTTFNQIDETWKILFMLCEEMTDEDVKLLKQKVPENSRNRIQSAEDWFCWALNENIFSRTNLSPLETLFKGYPNFLDIIKKKKDFEEYPLKVPSLSSPCGIALILNYENFDENSSLARRENSDKDIDALKEVWKIFGFVTKDFTDLNRSQTFEKIKECALADHTRYDAFVCCILSHGISNAVYSSDGNLIEISELIQPLMNDCLTLNEKPKMFFIQACQGTFVHQGPGKTVFYLGMHGQTTPAQPAPPPEPAPVPAFPPKPVSPAITTDTIICKSSIDGYVSFRDGNGSWFIQTLCKKMMQGGDTILISDVMMKVNAEISNFSANFGDSGPNKAKQTPEFRTSLKKKLILKKCSN